MWNSDFSQISPGLNLKRVNALEVDFLRALDFSVRVPASSYAKYYFQLRTMCSKLKQFGLKEVCLLNISVYIQSMFSVKFSLN